MRSYCGILALTLLATVAATSASAQTRIGPSQTVIGDFARGSNVAYDSKNNVYLVVSAYGNLNGAFVTGDGAVGPAFLIQGPFCHFPGVAYSPDVNGGAGGFLVTWHQSIGDGPAMVHARIVTSSGVMGPDTVIARTLWWEAAPDVAYSTVSKEFLVVWQSVGIIGQRVSSTGSLVGGNFSVTPPSYHRDPSIVYNPTTNEFMVVFGGEDATSPFAGFQRVAAGSGALVGPETVLNRAAGVYITDVAYNSETNQYLATWYQIGVWGRLIDAAGNMGPPQVESVNVMAYDALGLDYNATSRTFMMVSHIPGLVSDPTTRQDGAVEVNGATGIPVAGLGSRVIVTDAAAAQGNFYPKIASRTAKAEWLLSTATDFNHTTVQRLGSSASGLVGGPAPPPPPPPPPSCSTPSLSVASTVGVASPATTLAIAVTASGSCGWTAASNASWMQVSATGGNGSGNLTISVTRNTSAAARTGTLAIAGQAITVQQSGFNAASTTDLTGDGYSDFVWQYQPTGELALWTVQGTNVVSRQPLASVSDTSWKVVGTGDLDGNGVADIVWQKTDGTVAAWLWTPDGYVAGAGYLSISNVAPHWQIRAVGDLNGDGKADIVWEHDTEGWLGVWFMNGRNVTSVEYLSTSQQPDLNWLIVGAGDINGDGKADIVWQNQATGRLGAWLMNGSQVASMGYLSYYTQDLNWKVVGVGDVEGNGFADLIWENTATGAVGVWTLSGYSVQLIRSIYDGGAPAVVDLNWRMVGPG